MASILVLAPAHAEAPWQNLHDEVSRGELVPLPEILDWLEERYLGEVIEVELERDDGWVQYEIKMIGPQGQIVEFEFDAIDGRLMSIEGVNINAMQRH